MLYENICYWAKKRDLSIHQVERKAGIGNGSISRWGRTYEPKLKNLKKVADVLGVSVITLQRESKADEKEEHEYKNTQ